ARSRGSSRVRSRQERESTSSELGVAIRVAFDALKADADIPLTAAVSRTAGADDGADALSARETEIALLARTHSNAAIASRLGLSVRTIENHIHSALKKTGATNRQELFQLISR
ncbi:helix-turn-helix domain-containing protein, partial [Microbacterium sp. B24]|uniref:helix-turn-helix domain-containing protein n=1 Tax=Microbacterium sp. B24 TaxID=95616 RepID=UPI0011D1D325